MSDDVFQALKEVLVDRLRIEPDQITPTADLFDDLGLDSIDLMTAVMAIEERFSIDVSDDELEDVTTVGKAVDVLAAKVGTNA